MDKVNKKVLWLADYDLHQAMGGAQRSDKLIIDYGKKLGYKILKVNYETFGFHIDIHDYDILITSNLCALTIKHNGLIDEITKHKYHVRLEHDSNTYLSQKDRIKLFGSCKKTFFLTEYHYEFFKQDYGDIFKNVEIVADPINTSIFYDYKQDREDKILYVGYMHPLKGSYDFFDFALSNPNLQFVVSSWTEYPTLNFLCKNISNIEFLGVTPFEKMPDLYNKYKTLFYNPNLKEPFCRSVAEAVLCGTQILCNKQQQIGCLHEIKKYGIQTFKENCNNAEHNFWNKI
jgi:glycosyltransferase involved in cell wall biosynthesis